jgi:predicted transcriptional regulator
MPKTPNNTSDDTKPETADTKVRRALEAHPGATAAHLANVAGVGRSTATKILSHWAKEGLVIRTTGKDQSVPVTWTMHAEENDAVGEATEARDDAAVTPEQQPEPAAGDADEGDAAPATLEVPEANTPKKDRLPKGALYELVRDFLQAHPGEDFGPAKIGTELVRSSGAVNNALEKLVTNGLAAKTCEAPKRFRAS